LPFNYTGAVILGTVSIKDAKIREFLLLGWSNQGGWGGKDILALMRGMRSNVILMLGSVFPG
jgi:hypothetical protein